MSRKVDDPLFDEVELGSQIIKKMVEHLNERIDKHRTSNDKPQEEQETQMLRGRIAEIKVLLKALEK